MEKYDAVMEKHDAVMEKYDAVIVCNGAFPTHPLPLSIVDNASYLCCCDGAAQAVLSRGTKAPDAIVGDGDPRR